MCLSPVKITNNSAHFSSDTDNLYFYVPCGKCEECKQSLRNEWFVRCYFEWSKNSPQSTFFYTLTYNNDNLPSKYGIACFSKRHFQLFMKRLRKILDKRNLKVKYLVSCEYGELYHRPHLHVLFFLSDTIPYYLFYKIVEECWTYGFVKYGDNGGLVCNHRAIQYVTKYITKDFAFMDEHYYNICKVLLGKWKNILSAYNSRIGFIHFYIDLGVYPQMKFQCQFHDDGMHYCYEYELFKRLKRSFLAQLNDLLPFHLQSTNLGVSMLQESRDELRDLIPVLVGDGKVEMKPIPRYIKRKLWYDCVENERDGKCNKFILSEAGKAHFFNKVPLKVQKEKERLQSILSITDIKQDTLDLINTINDNKPVFLDVQHLVYWFNNFDLDLDVLAIYSAVFRGRCCCFDCALNADFVKKYYLEYAWYCIERTTDKDFGKIRFNEFVSMLWDRHPYFEIYDHALSVLDCLEVGLRIGKSMSELEKDKLAAKTRQLFNKT